MNTNRFSLTAIKGLLLVIASGTCLAPCPAADWPQLQYDAAHTGFTPEPIAGPFRLKWTCQLNEPTFPGAPPIAAGPYVYLGTAHGHLLAIDRQTGRIAWRYRTQAPVLSTPAFADNVVYVTSMDRYCHAVDVRTRELSWKFRATAGISVAPVLSEHGLFIADRAGHVFRLDPTSGEVVWQADVGGCVAAAPACRDGVLYVPSGDNRIHALDTPTGKTRWISDKLPGQAIRDYWLVATPDTLLVSTQLVLSAHETYANIEQAILNRFIEQHHGQPLDQTELLSQLTDWFEEHRHQRTLHLLDLQTGRERCVAPLISVHGGGCTGPLPAVHADGAAYLIFANVRLRASGWAFPGRLDTSTGAITPLIRGRYWIDKDEWEWQAAPGKSLGRTSMFDIGFCVNDQSWGVSGAGDTLLTVRDPGWNNIECRVSTLDLQTGEDRYIAPEDAKQAADAVSQGRYGGAFHATAAPMIVSDNQVIYKAVRNVVLCWEGNRP